VESQKRQVKKRLRGGNGKEVEGEGKRNEGKGRGAVKGMEREERK